MTDPSNIPDSPDPENQDDEVIGQAFQKSVRFLGILALLAAGLWFLSNYEPSAEPVESGPEVPIRPRSHDGTVSAPPLPFKDITLSAGIDFTHDDGARGKKLGFGPEANLGLDSRPLWARAHTAPLWA